MNLIPHPMYSLYADFVMRVFLDRCNEHNKNAKKGEKIEFFSYKFNIPSTNIPRKFEEFPSGQNLLEWLGYADDTVLEVLTKESAQLA